MSQHENYHEVLHQMQTFGVQFRDRDLPLRIDYPKRVGCGIKGKWWYWLRTFTLSNGRSYIVGIFGSYKSGESEKVDWKSPEVTQADRERLAIERAEAERLAAEHRRQEADFAAANARQQWAKGRPEGISPYLRKKGVIGESCRYMTDGSILVPLLRYDFDREHALRAVQRIYPGPRTHGRTGEELPTKTFTRGFDPHRCSVRLGLVRVGAPILICEGYATGLTLRMALDRRAPVFVALNAGNLMSVTQLVRELHKDSTILIAADDDWKTRIRGEPVNVGRTKAFEVCRKLDDVHVIYPVWSGKREDAWTDFNDLHQAEGLQPVRTQLMRTLHWIAPDIYEASA